MKTIKKSELQKQNNIAVILQSTLLLQYVTCSRQTAKCENGLLNVERYYNIDILIVP